MKSSFIITIFLLLTCIVLSQSTEYYLNCIIEESDKLIEPYVRNKPKNNQPKNNQPKNSKPKSIVQASKSIAKTYVPAPTTPPPVVVETTPNIIKKYLSDIKNANFLSTAQLQNIYGSIDYAMKQKSISNIDEMNKYLVFLQEKLNGIDSPPLNQIIYFCVSLPYAFNKFFMPDQKIPVPYNKLYATMSNIFKDPRYYTQIQIICIQWQQCMLLFIPSSNINDPRNDVFINIINQYISQLNSAITNLLNYSNPLYT